LNILCIVYYLAWTKVTHCHALIPPIVARQSSLASDFASKVK